MEFDIPGFGRATGISCADVRTLDMLSPTGGPNAWHYHQLMRAAGIDGQVLQKLYAAKMVGARTKAGGPNTEDVTPERLDGLPAQYIRTMIHASPRGVRLLEARPLRILFTVGRRRRWDLGHAVVTAGLVIEDALEAQKQELIDIKLGGGILHADEAAKAYRLKFTTAGHREANALSPEEFDRYAKPLEIHLAPHGKACLGIS